MTKKFPPPPPPPTSWIVERAKLPGWMERMTRAEFIGQPGYPVSWINHYSPTVLLDRGDGISLSLFATRTKEFQGVNSTARLWLRGRSLVFWGFDERGDLFSHPFGLRNASKETASWKGRECGSKKRGCDHRRILDDHPTPSSLKTMIIDERRSKGMEIRRNRFERYWTFSHSKRGKNGGIESIQRLIPMRCPLRKIYLGQRKGGKRNLAWKEANNKRRQ